MRLGQLLSPEIIAFYVSPVGRLNRKNFFVKFYAPWLLFLVILVLLEGEVGEPLFMFFLAVTFIPYCVTLIKRFQDFNASAWVSICFYHIGLFAWAMFLFFCFVVCVSAFAGGAKQEAHFWFPIISSCLFIMFWVAVILPLLLRGDTNPNRYGEPQVSRK